MNIPLNWLKRGSFWAAAIPIIISIVAVFVSWKIHKESSAAQEKFNTAQEKFNTAQEEFNIAQEEFNAINQDMQFTDILLTHYVGQKSCDKQQQVELYLAKKFTDSFDEGKTIMNISSICEDNDQAAVQEEITEQLAIAANATSILPVVKGLERKGFEKLLKGQLSEAQSNFKQAYEKYPTYHNVEEIFKKVLSQNRLNRYNNLNKNEQQVLKNEIFKEIVRYYSWGMPVDLKQEMQAKIDQFNLD